MADGSVGLLLFTGDPPAPKNRKLIFRSDALVPVCQNTAIFFIYISKLLYTRSDRLRGWKGLYDSTWDRWRDGTDTAFASSNVYLQFASTFNLESYPVYIHARTLN